MMYALFSRPEGASAQRPLGLLPLLEPLLSTRARVEARRGLVAFTPKTLHAEAERWYTWWKVAPSLLRFAGQSQRLSSLVAAPCPFPAFWASWLPVVAEYLGCVLFGRLEQWTHTRPLAEVAAMPTHLLFQLMAQLCYDALSGSEAFDAVARAEPDAAPPAAALGVCQGRCLTVFRQFVHFVVVWMHGLGAGGETWAEAWPAFHARVLAFHRQPPAGAGAGAAACFQAAESTGDGSAPTACMAVADDLVASFTPFRRPAALRSASAAPFERVRDVSAAAVRVWVRELAALHRLRLAARAVRARLLLGAAAPARDVALVPRLFGGLGFAAENALLGAAGAGGAEVVAPPRRFPARPRPRMMLPPALRGRAAPGGGAAAPGASSARALRWPDWPVFWAHSYRHARALLAEQCTQSPLMAVALVPPERMVDIDWLERLDDTHALFMHLEVAALVAHHLQTHLRGGVRGAGAAPPRELVAGGVAGARLSLHVALRGLLPAFQTALRAQTLEVLLHRFYWCQLSGNAGLSAPGVAARLLQHKLPQLERCAAACGSLFSEGDRGVFARTAAMLPVQALGQFLAAAMPPLQLALLELQTLLRLMSGQPQQTAYWVEALRALEHIGAQTRAAQRASLGGELVAPRAEEWVKGGGDGPPMLDWMLLRLWHPCPRFLEVVPALGAATLVPLARRYLSYLLRSFPALAARLDMGSWRACIFYSCLFEWVRGELHAVTQTLLARLRAARGAGAAGTAELLAYAEYGLPPDLAAFYAPEVAV